MKKTPENILSYQKHYNEKSFWTTLRKYGKKIGRKTVRQALILYYMYREKLNPQEKLLVLGVLGYLILPIDLIPDFLPVIGWTDDAAAIAMVYKKLICNATPEIIAMAEAKLAEWFG